MTCSRAIRWLTLALALLSLALPASAFAASPKASYSDIEDEVMCVTCNVPLGLAESPQAERQKARLRALVASGMTKQQIKDELVSEYGPNVLALPDSGGFGIAAYVAPIAAGAAILALLALLLPRWRQRSREREQDEQPLSAADSQRLDADMANYEL